MKRQVFAIYEINNNKIEFITITPFDNNDEKIDKIQVRVDNYYNFFNPKSKFKPKIKFCISGHFNEIGRLSLKLKTYFMYYNNKIENIFYIHIILWYINYVIRTCNSPIEIIKDDYKIIRN